MKRGINPRVPGVTGFPINTVKNAYRFVAGRLRAWPEAIINEGIMTFYRIAAGSRFRRLYLKIPHRNV